MGSHRGFPAGCQPKPSLIITIFLIIMLNFIDNLLEMLYITEELSKKAELFKKNKDF